MVVSCSIFVYVLHERMGESHLFEFSLDLGISTLEVSLFDFTTPGTRLFFFLFFLFTCPRDLSPFPDFWQLRTLLWCESVPRSPPPLTVFDFPPFLFNPNGNLRLSVQQTPFLAWADQSWHDAKTLTKDCEAIWSPRVPPSAEAGPLSLRRKPREEMRRRGRRKYKKRGRKRDERGDISIYGLCM